MTTERLVEAIKANDPDGKGIKRVWEAASACVDVYGKDTYPMFPGDCGNCLLAVAWTQRDIWEDSLGIRVGNAAWWRYGGEQRTHHYQDVVEWYDSFLKDSKEKEPSLKANLAVMDLLEEVYQNGE